MNIKYVHTNIIAVDWKSLSEFYIKVFDCIPVYPQRNLKGEWLEKGTGVNDISIEGIHLRLPGYDNSGPTLEIFSYSKTIDSESRYANSRGYGHIAFLVSDIEQILDKALKCGAKKLGKLVEKQIEGVGNLTFIYIRDPENNIIELQNLKKL